MREMGPVLVVFVVVMGLMAYFFDGVIDRRQRPNQALVSGSGGDSRVVLQRNVAQQFTAPGLINGEPVQFLVDTGADSVAVSEGVARRLGLPRGPAMPVMTAAGPSTAYATRLDRVSLGGIELQDVRGSIIPGMGKDDVLLGMSFLRHVDFSKQGDSLVIEAP